VSQEKMARLTSVLDEAIGGARIVKAFGLERNRIDRFSEETNNYASTMIRMTRIGSLASPLTEMLGVLMAVVLLWYVGSKMVSGDAGSGRFLLFIVGMLSMMQPIKSMSQINIKVQQGLAAAKRIFEILDTVPTIRNAPDAVAAPPFSRDLVFEDVCFEYAIDVPVVRNLNIRIERGTSVAVVGPSGAGKSTMIDLIPRFHDPSAGSITMDGTDLRSLTLESLRSQIGIVTQETILFEGSIGENIAMGSRGASREQVEAAARAANAHEFIVNAAEGYDTFIGERGRLLSGGQRQRLSIARALLKNPAILIFDEATSSLDTQSEALVQAAIDRLLEDRTAIIVAHRLSTIRRADVILVLQEGRLVQQGTHDDLIAEGGLYRRLFQMQETEPLPPTDR
jgi:subfamily B ATP-binding cassette protein MsbA